MFNIKETFKEDDGFTIYELVSDFVKCVLIKS